MTNADQIEDFIIRYSLEITFLYLAGLFIIIVSSPPFELWKMRLIAVLWIFGGGAGIFTSAYAMDSPEYGWPAECAPFLAAMFVGWMIFGAMLITSFLSWG